MNILKFHKSLIDNYKTYIQSFVNIKDNRVADFVEKKISEKKLWPEPLVQFNPTFEKGRLFSALVNEINLHPVLPKIFDGFELFKHQEEAILLGAQDREFVVTSGTGSGKSLTYIATVFNHVLHNIDSVNGKIQAVIVYPMNALINSQYKEIEKYKEKFEERYGKGYFPITFAQYTGQENNEEREALRANPPHIVLTNYMMLELILTRGGEDVDLRKNMLGNLKYLVFDELHTYRGRQGSDVSEHLSQFVINNALQGADQHAARAAVMRTHDVTEKTVLFQLRVLNVIAEQPMNKEIVAEEMWLWGYTGEVGMKQYIDKEKALALLMTATPAGNMEEGEKAYWLGEEMNWVADENQFRAITDEVALERANHLVESHTKFKKLVSGSVYKVVEPVLPMDVLGIYIFLPLVLKRYL